MDKDMEYKSEVKGNWGVEIGQTTVGYEAAPKRMKPYLIVNQINNTDKDYLVHI